VTDSGHSGRAVAVRVLIVGAISAFAVVSFGPLREAYGAIGTGLLLIGCLTLATTLFHRAPQLRVPLPRAARRPAAGPPADDQAELNERVDRVVIPSAALRNSDAQGRMMSVLGARAAHLSAREVDLMDWGFAFGVAWTVARSQDPAAPEDVISARALHATRAVYEAYRGAATPAAPAVNGEHARERQPSVPRRGPVHGGPAPGPAAGGAPA
jgi:hypothetical protein